MVWFLTLLGCAGGAGDSALASACGDVDGDGTDTGNVPDLAGSWSTTFAQENYSTTCAAENFSQSSETWIGAMQVSGSVPSLSMYFGTERGDEFFYGMVDRNGGVTFAGTHEHSAGMIYAQFGGLAHRDQYLDRDVIDGSAFLGLDVDADGQIDCSARGSWVARKSG